MAAGTFDMSAMAETARETGVNLANNPAATPLTQDEAKAKVKDHGWVERKAYDYTEYTKDRGARVAEADAIDEAVHDAADSKSIDVTPATAEKWMCNAAVYEWSDEYGEVGPPDEELEKDLFGDDFHNRSGEHLNTYDSFKVTFEGPSRVSPVVRFEDAGLHPMMLQNVTACGYTRPTPVQAYCIPAVLTGNDVVAVAQTGSGKTAAYLIPVLSRLMGKGRKLCAPRPNARTYTPDQRVRAEPLVLIVCPSRELAIQIFDEARRLCYRTQLRPCVIYGGAPTGFQREDLGRGCDILIATPGRLIDFMDKPGILSMNRCRYTVFDEADELLDADWEEDMKKIISGGDMNEDEDHLYMMFSATFPAAARKLAKSYMTSDYVRVRIGRPGSTIQNIKQAVIYVDQDRKQEALFDLLLSMPPSRTLIFVNAKRTADLIDDFLYNQGLPSTSMHSDRTQLEREDAIRSFRVGESPIMVTTGVSARGLDIRYVMHVINYDLPSAMHGGIAEYVHRIGRTARIGNEGLATSFYNERNEDIADDLCKILVESKQPIPDFLEGRVDAEAELEWNDDSDAESEAAAAENAAGVFGDAEAATGADAWGAEATAPDSGFQADTGFEADNGNTGFTAAGDGKLVDVW